MAHRQSRSAAFEAAARLGSAARARSPFMLMFLVAVLGCASRTPTQSPEGGAEAAKPTTVSTKSVGEIRAALAQARAESEWQKLGAYASELVRRGLMDDEEQAALVDSLRADALAEFADGTDGTLEALVSKRLRAISAHRKPKRPTGKKLVVLLPLSGPHAGLGAELRAAISVAQKDTGVVVTYLDTKGTEQGARDAVVAAAENHQAGALLGPVGERESIAAAREAAARRIPIGLLSPSENGASVRDGVFRLWPSAEAQAAAAAAIAVELGYDAPAILAPRDDIGRSVADAFVTAAKLAGSSSVRAGFYDPSGTELEPDLKKFLGLIPLENLRLRRHLRRYGYKKGWKTFSPDIDFDLLYIPDTYDRAALVASYLPFYNVELRADEIVDTLSLRRKHGGRIPSVVQLLGSHEWHHPSLLTRGGAAIEGALIVEACVGGPGEDYPDENAAQIAVRLRRAIGRPPSRFASMAHDAATMIFLRLRKRREAGKDLFIGASLPSGACGPARIDGRGQLRREPSLLRAEPGGLVPHEW